MELDNEGKMLSPALLATLYWGGLMVGRIISGLFNKISPRVQLVVTTSAATVLTLIAILLDNLWVLVSVGLCHSVIQNPDSAIVP